MLMKEAGEVAVLRFQAGNQISVFGKHSKLLADRQLQGNARPFFHRRLDDHLTPIKALGRGNERAVAATYRVRRLGKAV
jgi:hypothetical protein